MRHAGALVLFSALVIIATSSPEGELEALDLGASTAVENGRRGKITRRSIQRTGNMLMSSGSFFPQGFGVRWIGNSEEEELGEAASAEASSTPSVDGPKQLGEADQGPLSWMKVVAPKGLIQDAQKALCMGWKDLGRCHEGFVRQQCTDVCVQQHTDPGAVARSVNCWTSSIHFLSCGTSHTLTCNANRCETVQHGYAPGKKKCPIGKVQLYHAEQHPDIYARTWCVPTPSTDSCG